MLNPDIVMIVWNNLIYKLKVCLTWNLKLLKKYWPHLVKYKNWTSLCFGMTSECCFQANVLIFHCMLGLSLPCYALIPFLQPVVPLRLFWRLYAVLSFQFVGVIIEHIWAFPLQYCLECSDLKNVPRSLSFLEVDGRQSYIYLQLEHFKHMCNISVQIKSLPD